MRNLGSHFPCRARFRDGDYKYTKYSGKTIPGTKKSPPGGDFSVCREHVRRSGQPLRQRGADDALHDPVYPSGVGCTPSLVYSAAHRSVAGIHRTVIIHPCQPPLRGVLLQPGVQGGDLFGHRFDLGTPRILAAGSTEQRIGGCRRRGPARPSRRCFRRCVRIRSGRCCRRCRSSRRGSPRLSDGGRSRRRRKRQSIWDVTWPPIPRQAKLLSVKNSGWALSHPSVTNCP